MQARELIRRDISLWGSKIQKSLIHFFQLILKRHLLCLPGKQHAVFYFWGFRGQRVINMIAYLSVEHSERDMAPVEMKKK